MNDLIVFAPKGEHKINCTVGGKAKDLTVIVEASAVDRLNASLERKKEDKYTPCGYFDHARGARSFIAKRFSWDESKGIMLQVDWTKAGREAVQGGDYASFSPRLAILPSTQRIEGLARSGAEVGSLVNEPAFTDMPDVLAASRAEDGGIYEIACSRELAHALTIDKDGDIGDNNQKGALPFNTIMKDLIIKLLNLDDDIDDDAVEAALKAALSKVGKLEKVEGEAKEKEEELTKKIDEVEAARATEASKAEALQVELDAARAEIEKQKEGAKQSFIEAACASGKIAPKDEKSRATWEKLYEADCAAAQEAMNAIPAKTPTNLEEGGKPERVTRESLIADCARELNT